MISSNSQKMNKLEVILVVLGAVIIFLTLIFLSIAVALLVQNSESIKYHEIKVWIFYEEDEYLNLKTIVISICKKDSIEDIKLLIQAKEGIPADKQELHISGQLLEDGKLLGDYYFRSSSVISLTTERKYIHTNIT